MKSQRFFSKLLYEIHKNFRSFRRQNKQLEILYTKNSKKGFYDFFFLFKQNLMTKIFNSNAHRTGVILKKTFFYLS